MGFQGLRCQAPGTNVQGLVDQDPLHMCDLVVILGYFGIMDKKLETTVWGFGIRVSIFAIQA